MRRLKNTVQNDTSTESLAQSTCTVVDEQYPITLKKSTTLKELLVEGKYDTVIADSHELQRIFEKDPFTKKVTLEPLHFEHSCSLEYMHDAIDDAGYRSATLRELLTVGAQYPELQRRKILVALGSINMETYIHSSDAEWKLDNVIHIPLLADILGDRVLMLGEYDGKYRPGYYFLCVKK